MLPLKPPNIACWKGDECLGGYSSSADADNLSDKGYESWIYVLFILRSDIFYEGGTWKAGIELMGFKDLFIPIINFSVELSPVAVNFVCCSSRKTSMKYFSKFLVWLIIWLLSSNLAEPWTCKIRSKHWNQIKSMKCLYTVHYLVLIGTIDSTEVIDFESAGITCISYRCDNENYTAMYNKLYLHRILSINYKSINRGYYNTSGM